MRKKTGAAVAGFALAGASLVGTGSTGGHGCADSPLSRRKFCVNVTVTNCGAFSWEPQSVEGPTGFPAVQF